MLLYWGPDDWIAHPADVASLAAALPRLVASVPVPFAGFNHLDFMWAKDQSCQRNFAKVFEIFGESPYKGLFLIKSAHNPFHTLEV